MRSLNLIKLSARSQLHENQLLNFVFIDKYITLRHGLLAGTIVIPRHHKVNQIKTEDKRNCGHGKV